MSRSLHDKVKKTTSSGTLYQNTIVVIMLNARVRYIKYIFLLDKHSQSACNLNYDNFLTTIWEEV